VPVGGDDGPLPLVLSSPPGQRGDDVLVQSGLSVGASAASGSAVPRRELLVLDAATGAVRSRLAAPLEATPVAASRTVLVLSTPGSPSPAGGRLGGTVVAFDLADGRELWRLTPGAGTGAGPGSGAGPGVRDLQFWGGSLVAVDDDGVVTQLVDDTRVVGARRAHEEPRSAP
jgi:outer membrane protein assembly factor BamB